MEGFRPVPADLMWETAQAQKAGPAAAATLQDMSRTSPDEGLVDPDKPTQDELRKVLRGALEIKELGNDAFGKAEYYRALDLYEQALNRLDVLGETAEDARAGLKATLRYNRARAFFRIEDFRRSVLEARACLRMDPGHKKALKIMEELAPNLLAAGDTPHRAILPDTEILGGRLLSEGQAAMAGERLLRPRPAAPPQVPEVAEVKRAPKPSTHRIVKAILQLKDDGNTAYARGDTKEAMRLYSLGLTRLHDSRHELKRAAGASDGGQLEAALLANRAQVHLDLEDWDSALEDAIKCLDIEPNHAKALHRKQIAEDHIKFKQAQRSHGECLKNALHCKTLGNRYLVEGNLNAAVEEYGAGLEWLEGLSHGDAAVHETRLVLHANRSQGHLRLQQWKLALEDADEVLAEDPMHAKARFRRAKALLELGDKSEALAVLRRLADDDPTNKDLQDLMRRAEAEEDPAASQLEVEAPKAPKAPQKKEKKEKVDFLGNPIPKGRLEPAPGMSASKLLQDSSSAFDAGRLSESLGCVSAACTILERELGGAMRVIDPSTLDKPVIPPEKEPPPVTGAAQARKLLAAYGQKVRSELALGEFFNARRTANTAANLYKMQDARLREKFNDGYGLQSSATTVEVLQRVANGADAIERAEIALKHSRPGDAASLAASALLSLEKKEWPPAAPMCAELYALRAEAALRQGDGEAGELLAERAVALRPCGRAQACLREARAMRG